jgi:hypothetical protein
MREAKHLGGAMYQLMILSGSGPSGRVQPVKPPSPNLERLNLERDSMNETLLRNGVRHDQARAVVRPVFSPCEPGVCERCDQARESGAHLDPQYALLTR